MWVKVTDPFTAAPQWINLDTVSAIKRALVAKPRPLADGPSDGPDPGVNLFEVTRLFCAPGTIDCAELPEQILGCAPDARRHVVAKTLPAPSKRKGAR